MLNRLKRKADRHHVPGKFGLKLWDAATGALRHTFKGHTIRVSSVAVSPYGSRVLSGSSDGTVKLCDATTGGLVRTFGAILVGSLPLRFLAMAPTCCQPVLTAL